MMEDTRSSGELAGLNFGELVGWLVGRVAGESNGPGSKAAWTPHREVSTPLLFWFN
jgi:hypothetical protein